MLRNIISTITALLLLVTLTVSVSAEEALYSDVSDADWYFSALGVMSENKIITGFPDGTFKGSNFLSKDQYIVMLMRITNEDPGIVADGYWAQDYIDLASEYGWLDGMTITDYSLPVTRYEAALLTSRAAGYNESNYPQGLMGYQIYADDFEDFPELYAKGVLMNLKLGVITGYPDGTFKGDNTLTRAEGAVMAHRLFDPEVRRSTKSPETLQMLEDALAGSESLSSGLVVEDNELKMKDFSDGTSKSMSETGLTDDIADLSENILIDVIEALTEEEATLDAAAGYSYGMFNLNVLTEENDSLLLYTAQDGSSVITIDLLQLTDSDESIHGEARDLLLLICQNINYDYAEDMMVFMDTAYADRFNDSLDGRSETIEGNLLEVSAESSDYDVLRVQITID